ncbi:HalOD1 output domain-containing protein [Natrialbaceae archaeon AArc-T1-2]|uniref:HalOD1 output domain-containing protein n=1 Tax=Natrialbaceae archaeon AArc-T1-2 TaxID=3053904 RepID=UPI00255AE2DD|nr:HalOD1 output domain-containing protein [Natrialbaceae archaeon AArc-T1-2]WIV67685.1 hypothetical protein QQ977_02840 [Natrialbaceae archaeon AArc-T1-2]
MSTTQPQPSAHDETVTYALDGTETPSTAIVEAVAAASGRDAAPSPESSDPLPPLFNTVDPDALDSLFASAGEDVSLSFTYAGYEVVLENGTVSVTPA